MPRHGAGGGEPARAALATRWHPRTGLSRRSPARPQRRSTRLLFAVVLAALLLGLAYCLNGAAQTGGGPLPPDVGIGAGPEAASGAVAPPARVPPSTGAPSAPARGAPRAYVVQPGDTLARIALEHGTTIEALAQANKLDDPSRLSIGQQLTIPP